MAKKKIVFIHPDLGIGGAERVIVDAAVGLQKLGHEVVIYTSHCDKNHCFDEARDGTLDVRVRGNTIFPPHILGRFSILCAILRQVHLTFYLLFNEGTLLDPATVDVFFVDQLSACIPLLRWRLGNARILFYCHFPDKLLASRKSVIKSLYRYPFDWIEGWTTGLADTIVVNSRFTAGVFREAFPRIHSAPGIVYPCVDTEAWKTQKHLGGDSYPFLEGGERKIVLSINRFERKKDIALAIEAFAGLEEKYRKAARLIIAGGYDPRVHENDAYHRELISLAESSGLTSTTCRNYISSLSIPSDIDVLFLLSIPSTLKSFLLNTASLLVYTPSNEHFGIVPLEAMLAGLPVLATSSGGPLETVKDSITGWLRPRSAPEWSAVMKHALFELSDDQKKTMATLAKQRVEEEFSKDKMAETLDGEINRMFKPEFKRQKAGAGILVGLFLLGAIGAAAGLAATLMLR